MAITFSAAYLAQQLNGEIIGSSDVNIQTVARIESGKPGSLCFLANPKYEHFIYQTRASIVLVNKSFVPKQSVQATMIAVDDAYEAIATVLGMIQNAKSSLRKGRALSSKIALSAHIGKGVYVGSGAVIERRAKIGRGTQIYPQVFIGEDVVIGENCILYPGVKIYSGCIIGSRCILHANVVIGSDGFGFAPTPDGSYQKIPQTGIVTIEDDVEIGANTVVDRATMGTTLVSKGVKLDNLIQIAHNVTIGANTVIAAQSGVAGSSHIGAGCRIGGQVGVSGHLEIADGTQMCAQTGVIGNITEKNSVVMGTPAMPHREYLKSYALFKKLPKWKNNIQ